jgi:hypothetical protein
MNKKRYQPTKDGDLIAWTKNIKEQSTAHATEWNLASEDVNELNTRIGEAGTAYEANLNPETRNRQTSQRKKVAFKQLKEFLSYYTNRLEYNKLVPDDAILAMGLRPRERQAHQPDPPPVETPIIDVVTGQRHDLTVYASRPEHGHAVESITRKEYYGFKTYYRIEGESTWREQSSTRLHTIIVFDETDEGKHVEIEAAWINPRLQEGPRSARVRALIN